LTICKEILKNSFNQGRDAPIFFWRNNTGVDPDGQRRLTTKHENFTEQDFT
jgi:hypothetical protein